MDSLAGAVVEVGADLGPLTSLLAQAPTGLTGPLGQLGDVIAANMAQALTRGGQRHGGGNAGEQAGREQSKGFVREWLGAVPVVGGALEQVYGLFAGVTSRIVSPVTEGVGLAKDMLIGGLGLAAGVAGDLIHLNLGRAMARVSSFVFSTLSNTVTRAFTVVFGEQLGGVLSSVITVPLNALGGTITSWAGRIGSAIINPIRAALGTGLGNLDFWVGRSIAFEYSMVKFGAVLGGAGRQVGFTNEQLQRLAGTMAAVSPFTKGEVLEGMEKAFRFSTVRGEQFTRMMEVAIGMAPQFGGLEHAVQSLGMALQNPEHGLQRIAHHTGLLTEQQVKLIQEMAKSGAAIEDVQRAALDMMEVASRGVGEKLLATTQGQLQKLSAEWKGIGRSLGDVFLPLVDLATYVARAVVGAFGGGVVPIFRQLKELTTSWANSVKAFLEENAPTFKVWAEHLKGIMQNVFDGIKSGFKNIFSGLDAGGAAGFWESFKGGVTSTLAVIDTLTSSWSKFWSFLQAAGGIAWDYIKEAAAGFWEGATGKGESWVMNLRAMFLRLLRDLKNMLLDVIDQAALEIKKLNPIVANNARVEDDILEKKRIGRRLEARLEDAAAEKDRKAAAGKGRPNVGNADFPQEAAPEKSAFDLIRERWHDLLADMAGDVDKRRHAAEQKALPAGRDVFDLMREQLAKKGNAELNQPKPGDVGKMMGAEALYKQIQEGLTKVGDNAANKTAANTKITADELKQIAGFLRGGPFVKAAENLARLVPLG